jgi:hypothetical protein
MKQTRQAVHVIKQSVFLDVYDCNLKIYLLSYRTISLGQMLLGRMLSEVLWTNMVEQTLLQPYLFDLAFRMVVLV